MFRIRHNAGFALALVTLLSSASAALGPWVNEAPAILPPIPPALTVAPEIERKALGTPSHAGPRAANPVSPAKADSSKTTFFSGIVGPLAVVLVLIAMLAGVVVLLARMKGGLAATLSVGGKAPAGILEVLGRYPLGRGLTLVLLKVDRRVLLLSQSRNGRFGGLQLSPICELDSPEDVASILMKVRDADTDSLSSRFASVFKSLDRQAAETVSGNDGRILTSNAPVAEPPASRRTAHASHASASPRTRDKSGSDAAASIRRRLDALRTDAVGGLNGGGVGA